MEKKGQKKIGFIAIVVAIIAAIVASVVFAMVNQKNNQTTEDGSYLSDESFLATTYGTASLSGVSGYTVDKWTYKVQGVPAYCMWNGASLGFGESVAYQDSLFNLTSNSSIMRYYTKLNNNIGQLRWLADNMVIPNASADEWTCYKYNLQKLIGVNIDEAFPNKGEAVRQVNQALVWHYVNGLDYSTGNYFTSAQKVYYTKLIEQADKHSDYKGNTKASVTVSKDSNASIQSDGKIGPFTITNAYNLPVKMLVSKTGINGTIDIVDANNNSIGVVGQNADGTTSVYTKYNGKFYIKPANAIDRTNYDISVTVNLKYYRTTASVWWNSGHQPLLTLSRGEQVPASATFSSKFDAQMDLALKKQITKINDESVDSSVRSLSVDASELVAGSASTATYNMRKTPITVENSDKITYKLQVFNESKELDAYAKEITDYIPYGLKFVANRANANYNWTLYNKKGEQIKWNNENSLAYMAHLYKEGLGRSRTEEELKTDAGVIKHNDDYQSGKKTMEEQIKGILLSSEGLEYSNTLSNTDFVKMIYRAILNREADERGLNLRVSVLDDGSKTRESQIDALIYSPEFISMGYSKINEEDLENVAYIKSDYLYNKKIDKLTDANSLVNNSKYVEVELEVMKGESGLRTNIAEITNYGYMNGNTYVQANKTGIDRDSVQNNFDMPNSLTDYYGGNNTSIKEEPADYPGQQDDDDFEKIKIVSEVDLALKKTIVSVTSNGTKTDYNRFNEVDPSPLKNGKTTAYYYMNKNTLEVMQGDIVRYRIYVYNEGSVDATASEITDYLPSYLEYLPDDRINKQYGWKASNPDENGNVILTTPYLKNKLIDRYSRSMVENGSDINYKYVEVVCKVKEDTKANTRVVNIAQITKYETEDSILNYDRDSGTLGTNRVSMPSNESWPKYQTGFEFYAAPKTNGFYAWKGQQDDDDFEAVLVNKRPEFDLALRKFITEVNDIPIGQSREPNIFYTPIISEGTAYYMHNKEAVKVNGGDTVTYTIRIYNEGDIAGRATEITDYLPDGLIFLPDDNLNKQYGWSVVNGSNNKTIKTTYFKNKENLPANTSQQTFIENGYADVKIKCKVSEEKAKEKQYLTNRAEITGHIDENGNTAKIEGVDRDSVPENVKAQHSQEMLNYNPNPTTPYSDKTYNPGYEDDDDKETVYVEPTTEFTVKLLKVEKSKLNQANPDALRGATFEVAETYVPEFGHVVPGVGTYTSDNGIIAIGNKTKVRKNETYSYEIRETTAPDGFDNILEDGIEVRILVDENMNVNYFLCYSAETDSTTVMENIKIVKDENTNTFTILYANPPKEFDLALRKYITKIERDGEEVDTNGLIHDKSPILNTFSYAYYASNGTIAQFHTKEAVKVKKNDIVTYDIKVTNEGGVKGYATKITDYLPEGLEFIDNEFNRQNGWTVETTTDGTRAVSTTKLSNTLLNECQLRDFLMGRETDTWEAVVPIQCRVTKDPVKNNRVYLTNRAEITEDKAVSVAEGGTETILDIDDRDSTPKNVVSEHKTQMLNYDANEEYTKNKYYAGYEDDDDKDTLYIEPVGDFIFKLNKIDQDTKQSTSANFTIQKGNKNSGTARTTILPNEVVNGTYSYGEENAVINNTYYFIVNENTPGEDYINLLENKTVIAAAHLNENLELVLGEHLEEGETGAPEVSYYNRYGYAIFDDSNNLIGEGDTDLYYKIKAEINTQDNLPTLELTIPNQKEEKPFDLALRKFITKVERNGQEVDMQGALGDRSPRVDTFSYVNWLRNNTMSQFHTKEALKVEKNDIVTYTIMISNEADTKGYASKITDYLPAGLEFVDNEFNRQNGWVSEGTTNGITAVSTTKLSNTLLNECQVRDYVMGRQTTTWTAYVDIQCRVTKEPTTQVQYLTNRAEITEDKAVKISNDGTETVLDIEDRDSTPLNVRTAHEAEMLTYNANTSYSKNTYYKGYEDDDDKETVYIDRETEFNLELNKQNFVSNQVVTEPITFTVEELNPETEINRITDEDIISTQTFNITGVGQLTAKQHVKVNTEHRYRILETVNSETLQQSVSSVILKITVNSVGDATAEIESLNGGNWNSTYGSQYAFITNKVEHNSFVLVLRNEPKSKYKVILEKIDTQGNVITDKVAYFDIKREVGATTKAIPTTNGVITIEDSKAINQNVQHDIYGISEETPPTGYVGLNGTMNLHVLTKVQNDKYVIDTMNTYIELYTTENGASVTKYIRVGQFANMVGLYLEDGNTQVVKVRVANPEKTGKFKVQLAKVNENGTIITTNDAVFNVKKHIGSTQENEENYTTTNGIVSIEDGQNFLPNGNSITYVINEENAPTGYKKLQYNADLRVVGKETNEGYTFNDEYTKLIYKGREIQKSETPGVIQEGQDVGWYIDESLATPVITVYVKNEKITGKYNVILEKVDKNGNKITTSPAYFTIRRSASARPRPQPTTDGVLEIEDGKTIYSDDQEDIYQIYENTAPTGYGRMTGSLTLDVKTRENNGKYVIDESNTTLTYYKPDGNSEKIRLNTFTSNGGFQIFDGETATIKIKVVNPQLEGRYSLKVIKVDKDGNAIRTGEAEFTSKKYIGSNMNAEKPYTTIGSEVTIEDGDEFSSEGQLIGHIIKETKAPKGYQKFDGEIDMRIVSKKSGSNYVIDIDRTEMIVNNTAIPVSSNPGEFGENQNVAWYYDDSEEIPVVKIYVKDEKITGKVGLQIEKIDSITRQRVAGVVFGGLDPNQTLLTPVTTNADNPVVVDTQDITNEGSSYSYLLEEKSVPTGYTKLEYNKIMVRISTGLSEDGTKYVIKDVACSIIPISGGTEASKEYQMLRNGLSYSIVDGETQYVSVRVPNQPTRDYLLQVDKVDADDNSKFVSDADFTIETPSGTRNGPLRTGRFIDSKQNVKIDRAYVYTFKENSAPDPYINVFEGFSIRVEIYINDRGVVDQTKSSVRLLVPDDYDMTVEANRKRYEEAESYIGGLVFEANNRVELKIENPTKDVDYGLKLVKHTYGNRNKEVVGAKFDVKRTETENGEYTTIKSNLEVTADSDEVLDTVTKSKTGKTYYYEVEETSAPRGYIINVKAVRFKVQIALDGTMTKSIDKVKLLSETTNEYEWQNYTNEMQDLVSLSEPDENNTSTLYISNSVPLTLELVKKIAGANGTYRGGRFKIERITRGANNEISTELVYDGQSNTSLSIPDAAANSIYEFYIQEVAPLTSAETSDTDLNNDFENVKVHIQIKTDANGDVIQARRYTKVVDIIGINGRTLTDAEVISMKGKTKFTFEGNRVVFAMTDTPVRTEPNKYGFQLIKIDSETKDPIKDAEFSVSTDANGAAGLQMYDADPDTDGVQNPVTNEDGVIEIKDLLIDGYQHQNTFLINEQQISPEYVKLVGATVQVTVNLEGVTQASDITLDKISAELIGEHAQDYIDRGVEVKVNITEDKTIQIFISNIPNTYKFVMNKKDDQGNLIVTEQSRPDDGAVLFAMRQDTNEVIFPAEVLTEGTVSTKLNCAAGSTYSYIINETQTKSGYSSQLAGCIINLIVVVDSNGVVKDVGPEGTRVSVANPNPHNPVNLEEVSQLVSVSVDWIDGVRTVTLDVTNKPGYIVKMNKKDTLGRPINNVRITSARVVNGVENSEYVMEGSSSLQTKEYTINNGEEQTWRFREEYVAKPYYNVLDNGKYVEAKVKFENGEFKLISQAIYNSDGTPGRVITGTVNVTASKVNGRNILSLEITNPVKYSVNIAKVEEKIDGTLINVRGADMTLQQQINGRTVAAGYMAAVNAGSPSTLQNVVNVNDIYYLRIDENSAPDKHINILEGKYIEVATWIGSDNKLHTSGPNVYYVGEGSKQSRLVPTSDDVYNYIVLSNPVNDDDGYETTTLYVINPIEYEVNIAKVKTDEAHTPLANTTVTVNDDSELRISDGLTTSKKTETIKVGEEKSYWIRELETTTNHVNILKNKAVEVKVTAEEGGNVTIVSKHAYDITNINNPVQLSEEDENKVFEKVIIEKGTNSENNKQTINVTIENPIDYILDIYKVKTDGETGLPGAKISLNNVLVISNGATKYTGIVTASIGDERTFFIKENEPKEGYRNVLDGNKFLAVAVRVKEDETIELTNVDIVDISSTPYQYVSLAESEYKDYISVGVTPADSEGVQHVEVKIQNPKLFKIIIDKLKGDKETPLKGAVIKLNGEVVISGDNSHAEVTREIRIGDIYRVEVEEDSTPDGYVNILKDKKIIAELFLDRNEKLVVNYKLVNKNDPEEKAIEDSEILKYFFVNSANDSDEVSIKIVNPDEFTLELVKVDKDTRERMNNVTFNVSVADDVGDEVTLFDSKTFEPIDFENLTTSNIEGEDGKIVIPNILIQEEGTYVFTFHETRVYGYVEPMDIKVQVTVENVEGSYKVTEVKALEGDVKENGVSVTEEEPETVIIEAQNERVKGSYDLKLNKIDKLTSKKLDGAKFNVTVTKDGNAYTLYKSTNNVQDKEVIVPATLEVKNGVASIQNIRMDKEETYIIKLEETSSPDKYLDLEDPIEIEVVVGIEGNKYVLKSTRLVNNNKLASINNDTKTLEITVANEQFDLSLRKFITKVISCEGTSEEKEVEITSREPKPETSALLNKTATTATYKHTKEPVVLETGDTVIYTLRVYNEGDRAGYAKVITDHLPEGLEFVNDEFNAGYGWILDETDKTLRTVKTDYLSKDKNADNKIEAFNTENGKLDYKDVLIKCRIKDGLKAKTKLTNIAEITEFTDVNGKEVEDRDSNGGNLDVPKGDSLSNYKDEEIASGKEYIEGNEDDDDFEKVIVDEFDFSLRKFVTKVISKEGTESERVEEITSREPVPVTDDLASGKAQTATYNHTKEPVRLKVGDTVIYTLRVYNEGHRAGYVKTVTDHLPEGLELVNDEFNKKFGWTLVESDKTGRTITTNYLSKDTNVDNVIAAFNTETKELSYKDIQVKCKVKSGLKANAKLTNIAEITESTNLNGYSVTDRDSKGGNVDVPSGEELEKYKDDEIGSGKKYIEGNEDDDDFEKLIIEEFDLSLRKFITGVTNGRGEKSEVKTRVPVFKVDKDGKYVYNHDKEPVLVANQNVVEYTIRVYNEGTMDGYASLIKDNIPEGLEFLPNEALNIEYRWVMLDENGKETKDVSKAKFITTDYLSKEQEKTAGSNLLKAFDKVAYDAGTVKEPSYKDVKVAFKVTIPNTSDKIIINEAQISDDTDSNGREVDDVDSTTDKWIDGDDDQDIEKIKVQWFDLSLRKWVTKAIVIEDGKQTVTETGHKAEDNPEAAVKVDLKKSKIDDVVVKFEYQIRVKNESPIPGSVEEITDYIPEGLKFVKEDNPDWKEVSEGVVTTDKLSGKVLKKDETAEVTIVLTWINREDNMGLKINVAEISKDYNEYGSPDIDSVPNNKVPGEDDIDDAPVMLTVKTGEELVYAGLALAVLTILAGGAYSIKKYVLK